MTNLVLTAGRRLYGVFGFEIGRNPVQLIALAVVCALMLAGDDLRSLALRAMSDAYLAVSVFVGATLAAVYGAETLYKGDIGRFMQNSGRAQMPIAAFLGVLPGCGGAIVVVTQYTRGYASFGALVAVLIATMGDAAFLLLAREPITAMGVFAISFIIGTVAGWLVDAVHPKDFLRPERQDDAASNPVPQHAASTFPARWDTILYGVWFALFVPGLVLGILLACQVETDVLFGPLARFEPTHWIGAAGAGLCLVMWVFSRGRNSHTWMAAMSATGNPSVLRRTMLDTNFITTWVIFGFLVYELGTWVTGSGIESFFDIWAPLLPAMGVLVGFLPGCGPQIVVTTLYLAGLVPLSTQLGNALSNDGDALFPAIALAPRAAVVATLYTAIPALIVGYAWYALFE